MVGTYALSAGYYDAYYVKAQKIRRLIKNDFMAAFNDVDVILGPTTPNPAWKLGAKSSDPVAAYLEDVYTITANLAGLPGLSMPAGFVDGLPVGVQLLAPYSRKAACSTSRTVPASDRLAHPRPQRLLRNSHMQWEVVIGLEIHTQLATQSKIFSGSATTFGSEPNTQASLVDLGMPGVLPVLNQEAVRMACMFGLAIDAEIGQRNVFARKNYFYPDLPKGYQISQMDLPIVGKGHLDIALEDGTVKRIGVTRAHLEEDAGKPARRLQRRHRHRPEPRRHAAAGDRLRAGHAQRQGSRGLRQGDPRPGALPGHLRRQHGRRLAALRLQRVGPPERPGRVRHPLRDQERQLVPLHRAAINSEIQRQIDLIEDGGKVSRKPACTTRTRTRPAPCAARRKPTTTVTSPTRTCCRWSSSPRSSTACAPACRSCRRRRRALPEPVRPVGLRRQRAGLQPRAGRLLREVVKIGGDAKLAANWVMVELGSLLNKLGLEIDQSPVSAEQLGGMLLRIRTTPSAARSPRPCSRPWPLAKAMPTASSKAKA
jgi:aspartyl-tRNA(Asn)/glutamyl-tRNA(Gln) amidotransferase subunit B